MLRRITPFDFNGLAVCCNVMAVSNKGPHYVILTYRLFIPLSQG